MSSGRRVVLSIGNDAEMTIGTARQYSGDSNAIGNPTEALMAQTDVPGIKNDMKTATSPIGR